MAVAATSVLTQQILDRCRERAPGYDKDNRFFQEDFEDLKAAGYLRMAIPTEFGGLGMNLAEVGRETRKLAMYAPATALALNMHNYWVGDAADAWRSGDTSLQWILEEAAAGEIFAPGHAEHGNDIPEPLTLREVDDRRALPELERPEQRPPTRELHIVPVRRNRQDADRCHEAGI